MKLVCQPSMNSGGKPQKPKAWPDFQRQTLLLASGTQLIPPIPNSSHRFRDQLTSWGRSWYFGPIIYMALGYILKRWVLVAGSLPFRLMQLSICQAVKGENRGTCTTSSRETPVKKTRGKRSWLLWRNTWKCNRWTLEWKWKCSIWYP